MALRTCAEAGCPELVDKGYCLNHRRAREQQRGTREQRGYGVAHTALRKRWARRVAAGDVKCWRCGQRISPLEPFDLGHDDDDRSVYRGPEHVKCNRATANR